MRMRSPHDNELAPLNRGRLEVRVTHRPLRRCLLPSRGGSVLSLVTRAGQRRTWSICTLALRKKRGAPLACGSAPPVTGTFVFTTPPVTEADAVLSFASLSTQRCR
jgi:hypothetical protein